MDSVGTCRFGHELAKTAHTALGADLVTVFRFVEDHAPDPIAIASLQPADLARRAASPYASRYWKNDPSNIFVNRALPTGSCHLVSLAADELCDSSHRLDCYDAIGLSHQVSLIAASGREYVKLTLHRQSRAAFDTEELSAWGRHLPWLVPLFTKHVSSSVGQRMATPAAQRFEAYLADLCPALTPRERAVCSLIAIGISSEGIALRLKVSLNTVLTFRRRAYAKLHISSQAELLRMLL